MTAALRYEWTRIRTIRSTWWLSGLAVVLGVGLALVASIGLAGALGRPGAPEATDPKLAHAIVTDFATAGMPYFVGYLLAMVGVLAWGHEYRHGMVRATLTAVSSRTSVWAAKAVVAVGWALAVAALTMLGALAVGWLVLHGQGVDFGSGRVLRAAGQTLGYLVVFVLLATAFTALVRNQTAALVLLFLWPLVVENVLTVVASLVPGLRDHDGWTRFLPFNAGGRMLTLGGGHGVFGNPLSPLGGLVVFGGITVVVAAVSLVLFRRRDA